MKNLSAKIDRIITATHQALDFAGKATGSARAIHAEIAISHLLYLIELQQRQIAALEAHRHDQDHDQD